MTICVSIAPVQDLAISMQTQISPDFFANLRGLLRNERYDSGSYSVSRDRPISNSSCFEEEEGWMHANALPPSLPPSPIILPAGCQGYHHTALRATHFWVLTDFSIRRSEIPWHTLWAPLSICSLRVLLVIFFPLCYSSSSSLLAQ